MALSSIPQFRHVSPEEASPLYAAMKGFMPMYQQAQQQKMQQQAMQQQQQQMGLKNQLAQMQMARQKQQMQQADQKMNRKNVLGDQFSQMMGTPGQEAQPSPGVPFRDIPAKPGTGFLGGQIPADKMRAQYANILGASGDYGKAASVMFPKDSKQFALQSTLDEMGYKEGTPERQQAARSLATKGLLPQRVKAGRYAAGTASGLMKDVDENDVMDAVASYSGIIGEGKEGFEIAASSLGFGSDKYAKYQTFVDTTVPAIVAEIRTTLGDSVSDETNKTLKGMVSSGSWRGSKKQIDSKWKQLKKIHKIASESIRRDPLDVQRSLYGDKSQQVGAPPQGLLNMFGIGGINRNKSQVVPRETPPVHNPKDVMAEARKRGLI